jgi:hypothetical protein
MVDPLSAAPDPSTRNESPSGLRTVVTTLLVDGLAGCLLVVFIPLLVGLLALPLLASGLFFYYAAKAAPAASLYQNAPSCAADGSGGTPCVRVVHGTISAVNKLRSSRTPVVDYQFSIELPSGTGSATVSDFVLVQPPSWPRVGQSVDVTRYGGAITELAYDGFHIDTNDNPVVHEHDLIITGLFALTFGIVLNGGVFIRWRRRKKASGLAAG